MSDWDRIQQGWAHADLASSWLLGVLAYLAVLAGAAWLILTVAAPVGRWVTHRVRVHRLKRQADRSGRAVDQRDRPPYPFPCHCPSLPPSRRDLTGHEHGCPDHPATR